MGFMAVGAAAIGVAGSVYSSNKASKAAGEANDTAEADLAEQKRRYDEAKKFLGQQGVTGEAEWAKAQDYANQGLGLAQGQSDMFQRQSEMYGVKAEEYESAMTDYFDSFLDSFGPMLEENADSMNDFQRRYGPLMDNMTESIKQVSAAGLSAQGREQLSFDAETLGKNMQSSMVSRNMGRSGVSVETERRMAGDMAQQARAIDVNANAQSLQLQGQGIQSLNSMQNMQQGLADQKLGIMNQQGVAHQQVGQAYGNMSQSMYGASQNMFGQGFAGVNNANNNLTSMYGQMGQNRINQQMGFYSGMQTPNASNLINSQNNMASSYQADAGGFAKLAGTALGNADWSSLNASKTQAPGTTGGAGYQDTTK